MPKPRGATLRARMQRGRWTPRRLHADRERAAAVLKFLVDSGRDPARVEEVLKRLRDSYRATKREQGYEYHLPDDDAHPIGTWKRYRVSTRAQRKRELKQWRDEYLPSVELNPALKARLESFRKTAEEMEYLERAGSYGPQGPRRRGRPSAGIATALIELRGLFDRQHGQEPVWEYVAILARVLFAEDLGPGFGGESASKWAATCRQRSRRAKQIT